MRFDVWRRTEAGTVRRRNYEDVPLGDRWCAGLPKVISDAPVLWQARNPPTSAGKAAIGILH
jgi:hypothetical protein